jgi:NAD(P)-dependent dehydrogenase (short-subunit alcohol dehydrogenase family)
VDVRGKTVIVSGASRGIGKVVAVELGRRGANVVVAARTVEPRRTLAGTVGETAAAIEEAGGHALAVPTDLTSALDIDALARTTVDHFGGIDVLVNNAANTDGGSIVDWDRARWEAQIATNLLAPISLVQAVLPAMRARGGGVVVNVTSGAAQMWPPDQEPAGAEAKRLGKQFGYASSKAGLNRFGNIVAGELRELGVAIVTVDPGFTRTEVLEFMAERGVVDATAAAPMSVPARTIVHVITCDDPMAYTGTVIRVGEVGDEARPA